MTNKQTALIEIERQNLKAKYNKAIEELNKVLNSKEYLEVENKLDQLLDNEKYGTEEFETTEKEFEEMTKSYYEAKAAAEKEAIEYMGRNVDPIFTNKELTITQTLKALNILFK